MCFLVFRNIIFEHNEFHDVPFQHSSFTLKDPPLHVGLSASTAYVATSGSGESCKAIIAAVINNVTLEQIRVCINHRLLSSMVNTSK